MFKGILKSFFKTLNAGVIIITLAAPQFSLAKSLSAQQLISTSETSLQKIYHKSPALKVLTTKSGGALKAMSHPTQTMMLIWILAAVETYRQQNHLGPLNESKFDSQMMLEIADVLVNDLELYSGMVGASVAAAPLAKAFQELRVVLENKISRRLFVEFIHSGAVSFVTFVGWEASSQLWKEAIFHLPENQISAAESLRFMDLMTGRASKEHRTVFTNILKNVFHIFTLERPDQARDWIYNTWRLRLATGEFLTLVTGMVGGSVAAGSLLAPGAGTLAGFFVGSLGGLIGGGLTLLLPEELKASMTKGVRNVRSGYNQGVLLTYDKYIFEVGRNFQSNRQMRMLPASYQTEGRMQTVTWALQQKRHHRNKALTAMFEEIYDSKVKSQEAMMIAAMALEKAQNSNASNADDLNQITTLMEESAEAAKFNQEKIKNQFTVLFKGLDQDLNSLKSLLNRSDIFFPSQFQDVILKHISNLEGVKQQIQLIAQGTSPETFPFFSLTEQESHGLSVLSQNYLNIAHARGFDEAWFDD